MALIIKAETSHKNDDTIDDLINFMSVLGYKFAHSPVYATRETVFHHIRGATLMSVNGIFLNSGKVDLKKAVSTPLRTAPLVIDTARYRSFGTNIAAANMYNVASSVLEQNDRFMIRYLQTAPESLDVEAIQKIKHLPELLHEVVFNPDGSLRNDASIRDMYQVLNVLNTNIQYQKITDDCLKQNRQVLKPKTKLRVKAKEDKATLIMK